MARLKVNSITFINNTTMTLGQLTVVVGPNNVGKSRFLKELTGAITALSPPRLLIKDVDLRWPETASDLSMAGIAIRPWSNSFGIWVLEPTLFGEAHIGGTGEPQVSDKIVHQYKQNGHLLRSQVSFLTTEQRLTQLQFCESPLEAGQIQTLLHALYNAGPGVENEVRNIVKQTFRKDIKLDYTGLRQMGLRIGEDFSTLPIDPREARPILTSCERLDDQGDGLRSFVTVAVALKAADRPVMLIDEPETFLHPPQAFRIGQLIASESGETRQIVIATHSADVLRGILASGKTPNIVRIDRTAQGNSFTLLDSTRVAEIASDPLLSASRILEGLFYPGAVVVEAEADAKFYQALASKIRPVHGLHFVNADNKQTVPKVMRPYIEMGVRCAGIVDFDLISDRLDFAKQLDALVADKNEIEKVLLLRDKIAKFIDGQPLDERIKDVTKISKDMSEQIKSASIIIHSSEQAAASAAMRLFTELRKNAERLKAASSAWKQCKERGLQALTPELRSDFLTLAEICERNGLFINPSGELEASMVSHGIAYTGQKSDWIKAALVAVNGASVKLDAMPWEFVNRVLSYLQIEK